MPDRFLPRTGTRDTIAYAMKCDKCEKPAVVHEVTIKGGVKKEIHLCNEHAAEAGFIVNQAGLPINQMLKQFMVSQAAAGGSTRRESRTCSRCGLSWAAFRKTGTLGCPDCYESFIAELGPMIERAHGGGTHHVGRTPRRSKATIERRLEIRRLTQELEHAVAQEEYERAAKIRDRLNTLEPLPDDESASKRSERTQEE